MEHARVRVLLVEDEAVDRLAFTRAVHRENLPYDVRIATCVADAKVALAAEKFDVVLLDKVLPDGDGFDLFEAVDEFSAVLFMTRAEDVDLAVRAIKRGAADYLIKDQKRGYLKLLPAAVARALAHRSSRREARRYGRLLDEAFDRAPIGKTILSPTGRFMRVNRALCELTDRTSAELLAGDLALVIRPEEMGEVLAELRHLVADGEQRIRRERRWRHKSDVERWVQIDASRIVVESSEAPGVIWQVQDITARRHAIEALQASEERYRVLARNFPNGAVFLFDHDLRFVLAEGTGLAAVGLSKEQLEGRTIWEVFPPETSAEIEPSYRAALAGETVTTETSFRGVIYEANYLPVRDSTGRVAGGMGMTQDITARRRAQDALHESERQLRTAQAVGQLGSYVLDVPASRWTSSEVLDEIFGLPATGFTHDIASWVTIVHPSDRADMLRYFQEDVLGARRPFDREYRIVRLNDAAERWVHGRGELTIDAAGRITHMIGTIQDITARKRAEEELRQNEERFRHLLKSVTEYTYSIELHGEKPVATTHSPGSTLVTGYSPEEYSARPFLWFEMVELADREAVTQHAASGLSSETVKTIEHRIRHKNGSLRWVRNTLVPRRDSSGRLIACDGLIEDITERKLVEDALRESEEKFAKAFRNAPMLMAITDLADGTLLDFNEEALRVSGFTREEIAGRKSTEIGWISIETRTRLANEVREHGRVKDVETSFRAKDGREVVGLLSGESIMLGGKPRVLTTIVDITARKRLEDALRQSEERFRTLTAAAFEGIAITENGIIVDASDQLLTMFGYTRDEFLGRTVTDLVAPESRAKVAEHMRTGVEDAYEQRVLRKDGTAFDVEARARMMQVGTRRLRLTALRDITDRKRAEDDRLAFERRMQESQKLESLGTLAGGVAHDFNNILAAIFGNVALARTEVSAGHPAQIALTEISQLSERARDLVRQILAFSRPQSDQRAHVDLESLVREAAKMVRATVPAMVQLDIDAAANTPDVMADATQIHQVVVNLCTNAWQAIGEKPGLIAMHLARAEISAQQAATDPRLHEGLFALLTVRDSGCGMDSETLKHIFDPFFSTKGPGQGTGLGLAVVHGIVKAHRGFVTVDSKPGQGSQFCVYLPANVGKTPSPVQDLPAAAPISSAPDAANPARILFVDDEVPITKICSLLLRREGFSVTAFTSPDKALNAFVTDPTAFDLVITDMSMPVMNGVDLSIAMLRARPGMPIILATGFTASLTEEAAHRIGIASLINKPVGPAELLDKVRRALATAPGRG